MKFKAVLFSTHCVVASCVIPGTAHAGLFDEITNKAGSAFKDMVKGVTGNEQEKTDSTSALPDKDDALADNVTDKPIINSRMRCPPFAKDDSWHIRRAGYLSNGMTNTSDITDTVIDATADRAIVSRTGSNSMSQETQYRKRNNAVSLVKNRLQSQMGEMEVEYMPAINVCPLPEVGQRFTGMNNAPNGMSVTMTTQVIAINPYFVEVSVPAGTFETRKIELQTTARSQGQIQQQTRETIYFADGVGVVKSVIRFSDNVEVYDLLNYEF